MLGRDLLWFTRLTLMACSLILLTDGARWVNVRERISRMRDQYTPPRSRRHGPIVLREVIGFHGDESLKEMDISLPTAQGTRIVKMQETYGGLAVFDTIVTTEIEADSDALTGEITGWVVEDIDDDIATIKPNLTENDAIYIAELESGLLSQATFGGEICELEVYVTQAGKATLVFRVEFRAETKDGYFRPVFIIDANTGECLDRWSDLETYPARGLGGNDATGIRHYGKELPFLDVTRDGDSCKLENNKVKVVDMKSKDSISGDVPAVTFDCKTGPTDKINGAFSPASDAFYFGTKMYDMFVEWAHIPPLIRNKQILLRVHYGSNKVNALWDGSGVSFGDGDPKQGYYPLVVADIVAHELAHGFTAAHSQLIYKGQSGAVSEAFSDVAGEAGEMFINGHNDWVAGAEIVDDGLLRDYCEPFGAAIDHVSKYTADMDVHDSSGVVLKAFCYLGKVKGWTIRDIFLVFTVANRFYWHPSTDFTDAACGIAKAAYDIGLNTNHIEVAFDHVGVKTCDIEGYMRTLYPGHKVRGLSGKDRKHGMFKIKLTSRFAYKYLRVVTSEGSGDVDILISFRKKGNIKWKSTRDGNKEIVNIATPKPGRYFVKLVAKNSGTYSDVTLYFITRTVTISNNVQYRGVHHK